MWLRYLAISCLNVAASIFATIALTFYLPEKTPSSVLTGAIWLTVFVFTMIFSHWAFFKKLPERRDSVGLAAIHLMVFLILYFALGMFMFDYGPDAVLRLEILVQAALETAAIFLTAYRIRRLKIKNVLGEGMTI